MSNDPNAEPRHFCDECRFVQELRWRYWWKGAPDILACVKDDDVDELVLVTGDMEACRDWSQW